MSDTVSNQDDSSLFSTDAGDTAASTQDQRRELTPAGGLLSRLRAPEHWTEVEREAVLGELFFDGPEWLAYIKRFFSLIALSTADKCRKRISMDPAAAHSASSASRWCQRPSARSKPCASKSASFMLMCCPSCCLRVE